MKKGVGIIFSGGPAPGANTVISACALSFISQNIRCVGFYYGYENLQEFNKTKLNLFKDTHYTELTEQISKIRNHRGIFLKTSRANPGKYIKNKNDLNNPEKVKPLQNIKDALEYLDINVLLSIGGDDTLKTANFLKILGVNVIHIPKTIDNDYYGIPWTFGFWTAVDVAKMMILNLRADAMATDAFVIAEMMGRKSGWVTYAAGIAGESIKMVSVEDLKNPNELDVDDLVNSIVNLFELRIKMNKPYGVVCIAEGLVEKLPKKLRPTETDRHGNLKLDSAKIGDLIKQRVMAKFKKKTGIKIKVIFKQVGYETRASSPVSFDVVMGSMLGYGAYKLYTKKKFGHMVSVSDNFDIKAIPFRELIDPKTMLTKVRYVPKGSDFYDLKEVLAIREFEDM
jgi:6-phosphofructokinase 1